MRFTKLAVAALCAACFAGAAGAEPLKINEGWVAPGNWASIWLQKKDLARHFGQILLMDAGALRRHAADDHRRLPTTRSRSPISPIRRSASPSQNAGLDDLRIVSDEFQDGVARLLFAGIHGAQGRPDPQGRGPQGQSRRHQCRRQRRRRRHEGDAAQARLGAQPRLYRRRSAVTGHAAMLAEKKVDLMPAVLPFSYDPELRNIARPLFLQKDAIGVSDMVVWAVRKPFIDAHRAALVDFFEDTLRIMHWYRGPGESQAAMRSSRAWPSGRPQIFDWAFTKRDVYHDPNMIPNLDALQKQRRPDPRAWFHQGEFRREEIHRPQHRRRGGEAAQVTRASRSFNASTCRRRR